MDRSEGSMALSSLGRGPASTILQRIDVINRGRQGAKVARARISKASKNNFHFSGVGCHAHGFAWA